VHAHIFMRTLENEQKSVSSILYGERVVSQEKTRVSAYTRRSLITREFHFVEIKIIIIFHDVYLLTEHVDFMIIRIIIKLKSLRTKHALSEFRDLWMILNRKRLCCINKFAILSLFNVTRRVQIFYIMFLRVILKYSHSNRLNVITCKLIMSRLELQYWWMQQFF